ncbi:hypothetical protein PYCC9005_001985 [Savitreella phatthalungensis]
MAVNGDSGHAPASDANLTRREADVGADFRSDTVTIPTDGMLKAMVSAHFGDDVYGDSWSATDLESYVAGLCGKQAGLFCPTGTMGNQLCLRTHLKQPPYSIVCDARAHIVNYEGNALAMYSQALHVGVKPANGMYITPSEVEEALITGDDQHHADTAVIALENTLGGVVMPLDNIREIAQIARKHDISMHLDGARIWEASAATGIPLATYAAEFDSVSLCLSKGVGAPVGTVIVGSAAFIKKARHFRKIFGAGMRQVGILAGAARFAIDDVYPQKLKQVHIRTRRLADYASSLGFEFSLPPDTNMIWLDLAKAGISPARLIEIGQEHGVRLSGGRLVLHHQISDEGEEKVRKVLAQAAEQIVNK